MEAVLPSAFLYCGLPPRAFEARKRCADSEESATDVIMVNPIMGRRRLALALVLYTVFSAVSRIDGW